MIRLYAIKKALYPRHVFRIARAARPQVDNVFLVLEQDGIRGYGEASPNSFFGEDPFDVQLALSGLADYFRRQTLESVLDIGRIWEEVWERLAPSRACQCAVDLALWDLQAKRMGLTVGDAALGRAPEARPTSATLGLCPREEWPERLRELEGFPAIKIKLDASGDLELVRYIRERSQAALRVDANCAWSAADVPVLSEALAALGVEFIEQPLPPSEDGRMADILRASRLPILADESCAVSADVARLPGRFSGFNIKLVKCGGLTPALQMLREGRRLGLKVMVGCMLESSLLISAGLVVAQEADYADLDGSWLLREDPFRGVRMEQGRLRPGRGKGWGARPKFR